MHGSLQNRLGQVHPLHVLVFPFCSYEPGSIQVRAPQIRPAKICPGQVGLLEICLSEARPLELGLLKIGPKKDRLLEVRIPQNGLAEICPEEVGPLKIGPLEIGPLKIGLLEYRLLKVRLSEVCAPEVRPFERGPLKLRPLQARPLEVSLLERCRAEIGILEVGLLKVQLLKVRTAQIGIDLGVLLPPPIPGLYALMEYVEVILICHSYFTASNGHGCSSTPPRTRKHSLPKTSSLARYWLSFGGQSPDHGLNPADASISRWISRTGEDNRESDEPWSSPKVAPCRRSGHVMMSDRIRINLLRNHWLRSLRQRTVASQIASLGETRTLEKQMRPRPAPAETRIRVGIVGAGYHARQAHMPILEGLASQYEVVYAVTRTRKSAREFTQRFSLPAGTDHFQLASEYRPNAVLLALRSTLLDHYSRLYLAAGYHVLAETPGGEDPGALESLAELGSQNSARFMVATQMRFSEGATRFRERFLALVEELGPPVSIRMVANGYYWHHFNFLFGLWDRPISAIAGRGHVKANTVGIQYQGVGTTATIDSTTLPRECFRGEESIEADFGIGAIRLVGMNRLEDSFCEPPVQAGEAGGGQDFRRGHAASMGYREEWQAFHKMVTADAENRSDALSAARSVRLYQIVEDSIVGRKSITL